MSEFSYPAGSMGFASDFGYGVGVVSFIGVAITSLRYRIDQRKARPVVICHEAQKRGMLSKGSRGLWAAKVYLTNESQASAFNIRFGIDIDGNHVHWKHDPDDADASRLNVLRPNERYPDTAAIDLTIPDQLLWAIEGDPDERRSYWAHYQGPAGDWWFTSNPTGRSENLVIERIGSLRWGAVSRRQRKLSGTLSRGAAIRTEAIRSLNEAAEENRAAPSEARQEDVDDDEQRR